MSMFRAGSRLAGLVARSGAAPAASLSTVARVAAPKALAVRAPGALSVVPAQFAGVRSFATREDLIAEKPGSDSYDDSFERTKLAPGGDDGKRAFTYFLLGGMRFMYASAVRVAVMKFVATWSASADVLALASTEVDLSSIGKGATVTIKWRGKPVFIKNRTAEEIAVEAAVNMAELRDQQADADRTQQPEWLVVLGVCTHLGCVPLSGAGDFGGWFCPCHGSHYDVSGRIRKGPAPLNLEVPPYKFMPGNKLLIG